MNLITSSKPDVVDIDAGHKDPQLCSLYAPDIYNNLRVAEVRAVHVIHLFVIKVPSSSSTTIYSTIDYKFTVNH